ncbi:MAG: hypothetical protein JRI25_22580 [Deltaproteobacteria bacterium]|nr:hypothetical protein [Deltaproteobacteria bacterium]
MADLALFAFLGVLAGISVVGSVQFAHWIHLEVHRTLHAAWKESRRGLRVVGGKDS